ncbi:115_t:CDS:2 [Ambispora gerdemannii]|uniref:115_t:CDS:1 n=1 Tax=Ambispora gerdemannii TaxID=144530 RepID=A0A9N8YVH8_9GLOM|nr:115_t:CDS:2 [Ambispora gerdemannii]
MAHIVQSQFCPERGLIYLLVSGDDPDKKWKSAEEILSSRPELIELHEKLYNLKSKHYPQSFAIKPRLIPKTYQDLIENCLDEEHYNGSLDLMESFQNEREYLPVYHIRQIMGIIVDETVENSLVIRAYKLLQHILQTCGAEPFQSVWKIDKANIEQGFIWCEYPLDFWKFFETKLMLTLNDDSSSKVDRTLMLLNHLTNVHEMDIINNLESSLLIQLFTKNYGKVRTNIKYPIEALLAPFSTDDIIPIRTARVAQRLLEQIILLSYAGIICTDTLKRELYLLIIKLNPDNFRVFFQTLPCTTFKCKLLDHALQDTNLGEVQREHRYLCNASLDLSKIIHVYFQSKPYYRRVCRSTAIWRHTFMLMTLLQSYIQSKSLRISEKIYNGLRDDEKKLFVEDLVRQKLEELAQWIADEKNIKKEFRQSAKLLIDLASIVLDMQCSMEIEEN